jgi:ABC-2 type transport system permease protein
LFVAIAAFVGYLSSMKADTRQIAFMMHQVYLSEISLLKTVKKKATINTSIYLQLTKLLKDSIISEGYDGLIIPQSASVSDFETKIQYVSNNSPSISFIEDVQDVIAKKITNLNLLKVNLDTLAIQKAQSKVNINLTKASGEQSMKGLNEIKNSYSFGYLIMMFIIIYGNMVMRSVIEEKLIVLLKLLFLRSNLSLMIGKIVGTSLAGILQF